MQRGTITALILLLSIGTCGCVPLALAGGVAVLKALDDQNARENAVRREEAIRQARVRQQAEDQRRQQEMQERNRLAQAAQQAAEEQRRQQIAQTQRLQHEDAERRRLADLNRQREADERQAQVFLLTLEADLTAGRWDKGNVAHARQSVTDFDNSLATELSLAKLHAALGLLAYFADDYAMARSERARTRKLGITNPRIVAAPAWTPGAVAMFSTPQLKSSE